MNIRTGAKLLSAISEIINEHQGSKEVLDVCQHLENCVLNLLQEAYPGESIGNLVNAYRRIAVGV
jgi:hypothetical protein